MLGRSVWEGTNWSGYDGQRTARGLPLWLFSGAADGQAQELRWQHWPCPGPSLLLQLPCCSRAGREQQSPISNSCRDKPPGDTEAVDKGQGLGSVNSALCLCFPLAMEGEGLQPRRGLLRGCTQKGRRAPGGEGQWLRRVGSGTNHLVQAVLSLPGNFPSSSVPRFCHL